MRSAASRQLRRVRPAPPEFARRVEIEVRYWVKSGHEMLGASLSAFGPHLNPFVFNHSAFSTPFLLSGTPSFSIPSHAHEPVSPSGERFPTGADFVRIPTLSLHKE
jgi:hypothetical protein